MCSLTVFFDRAMPNRAKRQARAASPTGIWNPLEDLEMIRPYQRARDRPPGGTSSGRDIEHRRAAAGHRARPAPFIVGQAAGPAETGPRMEQPQEDWEERGGAPADEPADGAQPSTTGPHEPMHGAHHHHVPGAHAAQARRTTTTHAARAHLQDMVSQAWAVDTSATYVEQLRFAAADHVWPVELEGTHMACYAMCGYELHNGAVWLKVGPWHAAHGTAAVM